MTKELRRAFFKNNLSVRSEENGEKYIEGHFVVFNTETELWPGCFEKIAPEALDNSLINNDIRCLFNHNHDFVLGRKSCKTLELKKDEKGLWARALINQEDSSAMNVYAKVQRGDITGCSFGFYPIDEDYEQKDGKTVWTVKEADVVEISVCTFPAYEQTEIAARKKQQEANVEREIKVKKENLRKKLEGITCLDN